MGGVPVESPISHDLLWVTVGTRYSAALWLKGVRYMIAAKSEAWLCIEITAPLLVGNILLALARHERKRLLSRRSVAATE